MSRICRIAVFSGLLFAGTVEAQEWTRFRGPNGTGISDASDIPAKWSDADYHWKVKLPGGSHSSPVLWGERIFLTSCSEDSRIRHVLCLDSKDGSVIWQKRTQFDLHRRHKFNSFASATPTVDAERVYAVWSTPKSYMLLAFDHDGDPVWSRDLGPYVSQHSCGSSPIVYDGMVILGGDMDSEEQDNPSVQGDSFLIAVDAKTGKDRWRISRNSARVAYSTPCVYAPPGEKPQIVFNSQAHGITSLDPATGEVVWEVGGLFDKRSVSSPVFAGGLVFGSCGSGAGGNYVVGVRPGSHGESGGLKYKIDRAAPYVPTPLARGERIYFWSDAGIVSCVEAATGKPLWSKRLGGNYFGSPVWAQQRLYNISTDGEVVVLADSDEFKLLARNPLGELSHSTPAIANNRLYLRSYSHLVSVGGKK